MRKWTGGSACWLHADVEVYGVDGNHSEIRPLGSRKGEFENENLGWPTIPVYLDAAAPKGKRRCMENRAIIRVLFSVMNLASCQVKYNTSEGGGKLEALSVSVIEHIHCLGDFLLGHLPEVGFSRQKLTYKAV